MSLVDDSGSAPHRGARPSRRRFLAGGAAVVVGGGVGVGAGFLQPSSTPTPRPAPAALVEALAAERTLLALGATATRRDPALRADVAALRADHCAHLLALQAALAAYDPSPAPPVPTSQSMSPPSVSPPSVSPSVRAQLQAAEGAAARRAATRAARLTGPTAALLASISACERTHVELLT